MASSDSQIDKPQCRCPKRAELPDVNIKTGAQCINTEKASTMSVHMNKYVRVISTWPVITSYLSRTEFRNCCQYLLSGSSLGDTQIDQVPITKCQKSFHVNLKIKPEYNMNKMSFCYVLFYNTSMYCLYCILPTLKNIR